ncbi:MAG: glycine cleavage system aminomethyltransferase GcvT [Armatimonadetes bacterium]|nr:glycine cleavage system aminomethyltransferase GcvT [Armatimonadota bacterium]
MSAPMTSALTTPLYDRHVALGGRMVEFASYLLPVQYKGVIAEAKAVREGAGMFDVSHMARLTLSGDRVLDYLEFVTSNDVSKLADGHGQYSLLPNADGGVVDDIIVYRILDGLFKMVVNAANHGKDVAHLIAQNTYGVEIDDYSSKTAMIAVQGPKAADIVASLSSDPNAVHSAPFFGTMDVVVAGVPCFAARSGYTGEDGYELQCPSEQAGELWDALVEAGVEPCGLGSRDTLRVEAGLPLYGHELNDGLSPIAAGLGWVVSKTKTFLGSGPMNLARTEGTAIKLQGVRLEGKRLPMPGMEVFGPGEDGPRIGVVSSGVYSPLLECGVAFAFLDRHVKQGDACTVDVRGARVPGQVVNKRFFVRD